MSLKPLKPSKQARNLRRQQEKHLPQQPQPLLSKHQEQAVRSFLESASLRPKD